MAKAKITKNGNVKVVMSPAQWEVLNSIFQHVRMGDRNGATTVFSDLVIGLQEFNDENYFNSEDLDVETYITYTNKKGATRTRRGHTDADEFCIELDLKTGDSDYED